MKALAAALLATLALFTAPVFANVPGLLSYQGHVTDVSGNPIGNSSPVNRTVTFKLYTASTGGAPVYAESQTVTLSGGDFSVLIGNGTGVAGLPGPAAPANTPYVTLSNLFSGNLYLGITVDDGTNAADPEITPRQQIVSAAYAFRAKVADALADNALSTPMLADSSVTTNKVGAAQITTVKIADSNITTAKIANANITADKLDTSTIGLWTPSGTGVYRATGNVGIGQSNPGFPLTFAPTLGDKISLYANSGAHYGFGIQGSLLQVFTSSSGSDVAFGYGASASFTETMRIRGNGNLGLGTTAPAQKLHVNGGNLLVQNSSAPVVQVSTGSATADLGVATSTGNYSNSAAANDTILRSSGKLHLQSGTAASAITIDAANRVGFGTNAPASTIEAVGAIQAHDASIGPDNAYNGLIRTTRPASASQHINMVRAGNAVWSIGYVHNSNSFGIGGGASTDSSFAPFFRIDTAGNTSIGTTSTLAQLNVGTKTASWNFYGYLNTDGGGSGNGTYTNSPLSIYAEGHVLALEFFVSSDARIKTDLAPTDSAADLATLSRIQVTNYRHKDQSAAGATTQKKVVAQQVEQVFPQAVSSRTGVVPDIYRHAEANAGWVQLATGLRAGERVRVITPESDSLHVVLEANPAAFRLDLPASATDVFIYGREVPDLKSVDYDALSMLNVSATQELHRKVVTLETELAARDARLKTLEQRLAALEQLLSGSR